MKGYAIAPLVFALGASLAAGETDEHVRRYTVAAEKAPALPNQKQSIVFEHGELLVTLRDGGVWDIEGPVNHTRFFCGTYRLGVRFGRGQPACVNVKWLSDVEYVSSLKHCNSAVRIHNGSGTLVPDPAPETPFDIDTVTCAQIHIKCSGTCN
ncbi:MAG TPA: hypothetical protein VF268_00405 [Gammaproteobacteria bacterium]|jgi:hypothetical protein